MRLELSGLIRDGMIKKDGICTGVLSWSRGGSISIVIQNTNKERFIQLSYTGGREAKVMDYKIYLDSVPSNLGTGEVLFFICPITGERCRILYKAYDSPIFKSRQAYNNRIYYRLQQTSKNWLENTRYWNLNSRIKELEQLRYTYSYKGNKTKRALLLQKLQDEQAIADKRRIEFLAGSRIIRHVFGSR